MEKLVLFLSSALPMRSSLPSPYSSFRAVLHQKRRSARGTAHVTTVNGEEQRVSWYFCEQMETGTAWELAAATLLLVSEDQDKA